MTIVVTERALSGDLTEDEDNPNAEFQWMLEDDAGADFEPHEAAAALLSSAPSSYSGLTLLRYAVKPTETKKLYFGSTEYGKRKKREIDTFEFDFEIGVRTEKRTQSIATTSYTASGTAPAFQNAIGVQGDRIEGVDINVPTYAFSYTAYKDLSSVNATFKNNLYNCAAKVNSASFTVDGQAFAAGELLFLGATGSLRRSDQWQITYRFEASKNVSGLTIAGITGISKKGWEFLETLYQDVIDTVSGNFVVKRPKAVYVHQVYETANFSTYLGSL